MESDFDDLLTTTVVVSTGTPTRNVYGIESWSGNGSTYSARYVNRKGMVRDSDGNVIERTGELWIDSTAALSTHCRVKIGGTSGPAYPIALVEHFPDEDGTHHVKVTLGRSANRG